MAARLSSTLCVKNVVHEISFTIEPSTPSNDHQVRVIIDGQDLIAQFGDDMLGIDPPDFFADQALLQSGALIFARCDCGVVGCGDGTVQTARSDSSVTWGDFCPTIPEITSLIFSRQQFDSAVAAAKNNHDWETTERSAERLIAELDFSYLQDRGLAFCWASGRLDNKKISVCFDLESQYQVVAHVPWDHNTPESGVNVIQKELAKPPQEWSDVVYYPQGSVLGQPHLSGPGWQRG